jgi:RTX calcium-binding nonapeptide repeat (4 copies)
MWFRSPRRRVALVATLASLAFTALGDIAVGQTGTSVSPREAGAAEASGCGLVQRGTPGGESLVGTAAGDRIIAEGGRDKLRGLASADCLAGGSAADVLVGDRGRDRLLGGRGRDRIRAVDGERDTVRCGPGRDVARMDSDDTVSGCERIRTPSGPKPGPESPPRSQPDVEGDLSQPDPDGSRLGFSIQAPNSHSATLSWTSAPAGANDFEIYRDARLIDEVPVETRNYRDYLLWQSTAYRYELRAVGAWGAVIDSQTRTVNTPAQSGAFPRPYSNSSPWNTPIGPNPEVDPDSEAIIDFSISPHTGNANLTTSDKWGLGLAYADRSSRHYDIGCDLYGCHRQVAGRIPAYARANTGSDGKLTVVEPSSGAELDMWRAIYYSESDSWSASWRGLTDAFGWGFYCMPGQRCNGPNAAGNSGLAGVVRPEEIAQGHIDHALQMSGKSGYVRDDFIACPATHYDGTSSDPSAIPQGARIQLDPAFDVDAQPWPEWKKVISRALQAYGAIIDDSGGSLAVVAESNINRGYDAWQQAGLGATTGTRNISALPWNRMRVLKITEC